MTQKTPTSPPNTVVSAEHDAGTIFLDNGQVGGTAEGGAWEHAGKYDIDPHVITLNNGWNNADTTFLIGNAGDALERLVDEGRADNLNEAAELYYEEHPQAFGADPDA